MQFSLVRLERPESLVVAEKNTFAAAFSATHSTFSKTQSMYTITANFIFLSLEARSDLHSASLFFASFSHKA